MMPDAEETTRDDAEALRKVMTRLEAEMRRMEINLQAMRDMETEKESVGGKDNGDNR